MGSGSSAGPDPYSHFSGSSRRKPTVMTAVLLFVIVALVLAIIGVLVQGLFYLLIIGIVVLVADLVYAAWRWRRGGRRPVR